MVAIIITIPLAITGQTIVQESNNLRNASHAVSVWLGEASLMHINELSIEDEEVRVQLIGPQPGPPSSLTLSQTIIVEIGRPLTTQIAWIEEHREITR
ncbi:MAG: hypothetical protein ABFR95_00015 [Actinomycetota bacterium]